MAFPHLAMPVRLAYEGTTGKRLDRPATDHIAIGERA
jgi:hypothetical protein